MECSIKYVCRSVCIKLVFHGTVTIIGILHSDIGDNYLDG